MASDSMPSSGIWNAMDCRVAGEERSPTQQAEDERPAPTSRATRGSWCRRRQPEQASAHRGLRRDVAHAVAPARMRRFCDQAVATRHEDHDADEERRPVG